MLGILWLGVWLDSEEGGECFLYNNIGQKCVNKWILIDAFHITMFANRNVHCTLAAWTCPSGVGSKAKWRATLIWMIPIISGISRRLWTTDVWTEWKFYANNKICFGYVERDVELGILATPPTHTVLHSTDVIANDFSLLYYHRNCINSAKRIHQRPFTWVLTEHVWASYSHEKRQQ